MNQHRMIRTAGVAAVAVATAMAVGHGMGDTARAGAGPSVDVAEVGPDTASAVRTNGVEQRASVARVGAAPQGTSDSPAAPTCTIGDAWVVADRAVFTVGPTGCEDQVGPISFSAFALPDGMREPYDQQVLIAHHPDNGSFYGAGRYELRIALGSPCNWQTDLYVGESSMPRFSDLLAFDYVEGRECAGATTTTGPDDTTTTTTASGGDTTTTTTTTTEPGDDDTTTTTTGPRDDSTTTTTTTTGPGDTTTTTASGGDSTTTTTTTGPGDTTTTTASGGDSTTTTTGPGDDTTTTTTASGGDSTTTTSTSTASGAVTTTTAAAAGPTTAVTTTTLGPDTLPVTGPSGSATLAVFAGLLTGLGLVTRRLARR